MALEEGIGGWRLETDNCAKCCVVVMPRKAGSRKPKAESRKPKAGRESFRESENPLLVFKKYGQFCSRFLRGLSSHNYFISNKMRGD